MFLSKDSRAVEELSISTDRQQFGTKGNPSQMTSGLGALKDHRNLPALCSKRREGQVPPKHHARHLGKPESTPMKKKAMEPESTTSKILIPSN